jgi:tight adherence protein C
MIDPGLALAFGVMSALVGALVIYSGLAHQRQADLADPTEYLRSLELDGEADEFQQILDEPFITRVLRPLVSRVLGGFAQALPGNYRDNVHRRVVHAGLVGQVRAEELIVGQLLASVGLFVLVLALITFGDVSSRMSVVLLVGFPVVGAMLPSVWLNRKTRERQDMILKDLPDTLDLLAISVEAGVGFEGALAIVCEQFESPLATEFSRTLREMELGLPRREALQALKRRTEVPELSNFVLALTQADALGMPIGRVLKTQASEMRTKRRQWAREKAAKLPVKILFPLILFIFPPVFIIVLGPAAAEIGQSFK